MTKILGDCRDLAIHRLMLAFSSMLDRVGDLLMDRAGRTDVRDEQSLYLDARALLKSERATLMAEFEQRLRRRVDDRIAGREDPRQDYADVDSTKLTRVDKSAMDESVVTGNITRIVENVCHDELAVLNRGFAHLMGRPDLETDDNPRAPATILDAFTDAVGDMDPGALVLPKMLTGYTDSYDYRALGIDAYGVESWRTTDEISATVHGNNERVPVPEVRFGVEFYYRIVEQLAR